VKFEVRHWAARDGAGGSEALWMGAAPNTAAEALASIVNGYRAGLGALAPMRPVALRIGERWGHHFLEITTKALMPATDGSGWGVTFVYAPSGTPALSDDDVAVAGRSTMAEAGGDIFAEVARLLGPLPASGGSGDPIVREPIASHDEDEDLPLAAAPARSLENEGNEIDEETPRVAPLAGRGLRMAH
jgi:hypothetical protein